MITDMAYNRSVWHMDINAGQLLQGEKVGNESSKIKRILSMEGNVERGEGQGHLGSERIWN